jgi:hypothetical protein
MEGGKVQDEDCTPAGNKVQHVRAHWASLDSSTFYASEGS